MKMYLDPDYDWYIYPQDPEVPIEDPYAIWIETGRAKLHELHQLKIYRINTGTVTNGVYRPLNWDIIFLPLDNTT